MKKYKVFIDENLPRQLAKGLHELQQPQNKKDGIEIEVLSIKDIYGEGAPDEGWIPKVGKEKGIVITQDFSIYTTKHQKELYQKEGVGMLFFNQGKSGFTYWEMVKQLISRWDDIKQIVRKNKPPFAYRCSARTAKFEKLN